MSEIKAGELKRKKPKHGESQLQQACIKFFDLQYPKYKQLLFAIPNGGRRGKIEASIMKGEGVRAGVADLFFAMPGNKDGWPRHGLFIEMKYGDGKQTDAQKKFQELIDVYAYYGYAVIRDFDSFKNLITEYLK